MTDYTFNDLMRFAVFCFSPWAIIKRSVCFIYPFDFVGIKSGDFLKGNYEA